ncbi:hypothetical protein DVH05_000100 [Phytophthora capsici]|nr:hypothetical protein DVH05_000100 [Phytophthora capsici]
MAKDFENRAEMTSADCIPLLVASVRDGSNPQRKSTILMLSRLSMFPECLEELIEAGAIEQFMVMLRDGLNGFETDILPLTLIQIARSDVGRKAIEATGSIPLLISMVRTGKSSGQKESCAQVLVNLSVDERLREVIESARRRA